MNYLPSLKVIAVIALTGFAQVSLAADNQDAESQLIEDKVVNFVENSHSKATVDDITADDFQYTLSGGVIVNKDQVMAGYANGDKPKLMNSIYDVHNFDVQIYDYFAVARYVAVNSFVDGSGYGEAYYYSTVILMKHGNEWKMTSLQSTKLNELPK